MALLRTKGEACFLKLFTQSEIESRQKKWHNFLNEEKTRATIIFPFEVGTKTRRKGIKIKTP